MMAIFFCDIIAPFSFFLLNNHINDNKVMFIFFFMFFIWLGRGGRASAWIDFKPLYLKKF